MSLARTSAGVAWQCRYQASAARLIAVIGMIAAGHADAPGPSTQALLLST